jgi:DNA repair photolyase
MERRKYLPITCKSALNRVSGMPFRWSLNPYRGCTHGCEYCYAMATHDYYGLRTDEFRTTIFVKTNLVEVLRRELARPSWRGEKIAIGTATDPYQPCEGQYRITREALQTMLDFENAISIVTKSTLVLRNLDLLTELASHAEVTVWFTITTLDRALWRSMEPGTPPPAKRLEVMKRLADAGIQTGVLMSPVIPAITDSSESIDAVARAAKDHGAQSFGADTLRLAPLVKEHWLQFVSRDFPDLLPRYEAAFQGANAPIAYREAIEKRIRRARQRAGFDPEGRGRPGHQEKQSPATYRSSPDRQLRLPFPQ